MKSESIKTYTRRIVSANKSEIIIILYDIIEENLSFAENEGNTDHEEERKKALKQAIVFVKELLSSLDMKIELSHSLASLYLYVLKCLHTALRNGTTEEIKTAQRIMGKLRLSFLEVAKADTSAPVMEETEQLFAGFTYGKNLGLSETSLDEKTVNRGYRV